MLKKIEYGQELYAIIIKRSYNEKGIHFFTPNDFSQQLAYMNRPKGYVIEPHLHKRVERTVFYTQEVLFIKSGKVKVDFYTQEKFCFDSVILGSGDVIMLAQGGHGFEMLEPTEMIEVKQGPYSGDQDKVRF